MDQLLKLAQQVGMNESQGQDAMGGILSLLQSNVSSEDFAKIEQAVPGAGTAASEAGTKANNDPTANLMSSAMGMFGGGGSGSNTNSSSAGGGALGSIPQLLAFAAKMGIDAKQITALLPMVMQFLQSNAGVDASSVLGGGGSTTSSGSGSASGGGGTNDLAAQAQGFLGGFMK